MYIKYKVNENISPYNENKKFLNKITATTNRLNNAIKAKYFL